MLPVDPMNTLCQMNKIDGLTMTEEVWEMTPDAVQLVRSVIAMRGRTKSERVMADDTCMRLSPFLFTVYDDSSLDPGPELIEPHAVALPLRRNRIRLGKGHFTRKLPSSLEKHRLDNAPEEQIIEPRLSVDEIL